MGVKELHFRAGKTREKGVKVGEERTGPDKGKDVLLRESRERVLVGAVEDLLAHPVASTLRGRLQDEVTKHPRAHVVGCRSGRGLATDGPEEEPGAAGVGVVPGGVRLVAEHVIWEGFERRRIFEPARPVASHGWSGGVFCVCCPRRGALKEIWVHGMKNARTSEY